MNIHEHQAKELLKKFGAPVLKGIVIFDVNEIDSKKKKLGSNSFVVKAQIHAGGRGKAGGIKMAKNFQELKKISKGILGKTLITHQTGPTAYPILNTAYSFLPSLRKFSASSMYNFAFINTSSYSFIFS